MSNSRKLNELTDLLKNKYGLDEIKVEDNEVTDDENRVRLTFQYSKKNMPPCSMEDQTAILETGIRKAIKFLNDNGEGDKVVNQHRNWPISHAG